jgi:hypothetical protein
MSTTTDFQTGQTSAEEKDCLLWMSDSRRVKPIQIKTLDNYDGWVLSQSERLDIGLILERAFANFKITREAFLSK